MSYIRYIIILCFKGTVTRKRIMESVRENMKKKKWYFIILIMLLGVVGIGIFYGGYQKSSGEHDTLPNYFIISEELDGVKTIDKVTEILDKTKNN